MAKFTIVWMQPILHSGREREEVEADHYSDAGEWIDFFEEDPNGNYVPKLRVRAAEVRRIDRA